MSEPEYLGDGVYVSHDGYQYWLKVDDIHIALDPHVVQALFRYMERAENVTIEVKPNE